MVWENDRHINEKAPEGMMGGAICTCDECKIDRFKERIKKVDPRAKHFYVIGDYITWTENKLTAEELESLKRNPEAVDALRQTFKKVGQIND